MNTPRNITMGLAVALVLAGLGGCVSSSRSNVTVQESIKFSKGQELNDLLRAKQVGAVTDAEYENVRQVLMSRPN
jgi:hypothetical protein